MWRTYNVVAIQLNKKASNMRHITGFGNNNINISERSMYRQFY